MTSPDHDSVKAGVTDAWDFWLSQHDYSVPDTIKAAIKDVFADWLDRRGEAIIRETVAAETRNYLRDNPPATPSPASDQ
jgi:hypothetical protein